jgi:hypothetical protein
MNNKKRKRLISPTGSNIPLVPVEIKNPNAPQSKKDFFEQEAREQRELAEKPLRDFQRVTTQLANEYFEVLRQFWSRDIPTLAKVLSRRQALEQTGCCDDIGLPKGTRDETAAGKATRAFIAALPSRGISLSDDGKTRYSMYVLAQIMGLDVSITEESLQTMLDRFISVGAFRDGEVTVDRSKQPRNPEPPAPRVTLADIESEADERTSRRLAEQIYYDERQPMVRAWFESLLTQHNYSISGDDIKRCKQWFERNNKSFLTPQHFNECRRSNIFAGYWPETMLTPDEVAARAIENGPALGTLGFNEKQRLLSEVKRLRDQVN